MKRIVIWLGSTITVVVLLFGYRTSTNNTTSASAESSIQSGYLATGSAPTTPSAVPRTPTAAGIDPVTPSAGGAGSATAAPTTAGPSSPAAAPTTYTGSVAQTRWGPVQVQITVTGDQITAATVLQYPNGNGKDQQINARALPILIQDTLTAQSADIDMVSGATVTSDGYLQSLQSALDEAGL